MTEDVEMILELIHEERRQTIHEIADTVRISYGVCQEILTENLVCSPTPDKWSKAAARKRFSWAARVG
jgi:hypothetical protein